MAGTPDAQPQISFYSNQGKDHLSLSVPDRHGQQFQLINAPVANIPKADTQTNWISSLGQLGIPQPEISQLLLMADWRAYNSRPTNASGTPVFYDSFDIMQSIATAIEVYYQENDLVAFGQRHTALEAIRTTADRIVGRRSTSLTAPAA